MRTLPAIVPVLAAALLLLVAGPVGAEGGATSAEVPWRIQEVRFQGFDNLSLELVRSVLETPVPGIITLGKLPVFDPARLERDAARLVQLYHEHGFFQATVVTRVERHPATHTVSITFEAHELDLVRIEAVELRFQPPEAAARWKKALAAVLKLKPGQRFTLAAYTRAKRDLARYLADQAHPLNQVRGQVQVWPRDHRARVILQVTPGPRVLFGPVEVKGNEDIEAWFIRRTKTFARGQPYSAQALEETRNALLDTGFFNAVELQPLFPRMQAGQVPIRIVVRERDAHSLRLGVGWGTEDNFRLRIAQVNRNMFGLHETFTIEGKLSAIYEGLVGRMRIPYAFTTRTTLLLSGGMEQKDTEAYVNRRLFFTPLLEYRLSKHCAFYLGYNVEKDRLRELKTAVPDPEEEKALQYISSVPLGLRYDTRNSVLNPTRGTYFHLRVEVASDAIGSEVEFLRPVAELRQVWPLDRPRGWYLATRAEAGLCYPLPGTERIPLIRRFFVGGPDTVRGFPYQRLGPLDESGKPLGGEAYAVGNLELRFPLWQKLGGVLFLDAGNAYENISREIGSLRFTAGAGLRYHTPVGPLRLDFGYQLNPPADAPIGRYEFYLSVGQAF